MSLPVLAFISAWVALERWVTTIAQVSDMPYPIGIVHVGSPCTLGCLVNTDLP